MKTGRELICPPISSELGFDNRYESLPATAYFEGCRRGDENLIRLSGLLSDLVDTIPYNNDYFDILVAPLADQIEGILKRFGVAYD